MIAWLIAHPRRIAYGLAGAAILGAATWAWVAVAGWRHDSERLPVVARERDALAATLRQAASEAVRNARIADDYHDQIDRLRADLRARPVRVLRPACPAATAAARPAGRADAPAAGPEPGPPAADPGPLDVTADLSAYAEDCAATGITLSALQQWARERP